MPSDISRRWKRPQSEDAYRLALAALALQAESHAGEGGFARISGKGFLLLDHLAARGETMDGAWRWLTDGRTIQGLTGEAAASETTALAILALASRAKHRHAAQEGAAFLLRERQPGGGWGSPFAAALALRALSASAVGSNTLGSVQVIVNGKPVAWLNARRPAIDLRGYLVSGSNDIALAPSGSATFLYELHLTSAGIPRQVRFGAPALSSNYSPLRMRPGESTTFTARLAGDTPHPVCLEVPLPAGFRPVRDDLEEMVRSRQAAAFSIDPRQVLIYTNGDRRATRWIVLRLVASGPAEVTAPAPAAYPLADPTARALGQSARLTVEQLP